MCTLLSCCLEGIPVSVSLYFPTGHVTRVKVVLSFHVSCLDFPRRSRNDMSISTRERIVHRFSHANEKQRSTFAVPFISRRHANPTQSAVHSILMYSGRTGTQESVLNYRTRQGEWVDRSRGAEIVFLLADVLTLKLFTVSTRILAE